MKQPARTGAKERFAGFTHIVTPLLLVVMLGAAAAIWFAVTETATAQHAQHWQEAPHVPLESLPPEERPQMYTQAFLPSRVPVGKDAKTIYLYVSPTTTRYLASAGGNYDTLLKPWRQFFAQRSYRYIESTRLPDAQHAPNAVLILPSSLALDDTERQQLQAFQRNGGGILATSALGARDANGAWLSYDLLMDLFGVSVVGDVAPESEARFLNLFGETPLTIGYPAGQRIWLENTAERALRMTGGYVAARYMDWVRTAVRADHGAAVLFDEHRADKNYARWAVFGFAETSWGAQSKELAGLLENALHWLSRGTAVAKAAWPAPYRSAYLLEMDTEEKFASAREFAAMLDERGLHGTFYSLTSEAVRYPHLVRELARRHEIGLHGDVHNGFRAQAPAEQDQRLQRMLADMQGILGKSVKITGFRAPREEYDRTTEQLLQDNGFLHHAADPNRSDARLPFFAQTRAGEAEQQLVVLPRTEDDDISLRANESGAQTETRLKSVLKAQFDNVREMGAMGLLSIHSQYFSKGSALHAAMPDFLQAIVQHRKEVWVAPGRDIAQWWHERERMQHRISGNSDRFRLELTVDGTRRLEHASLIVTHRNAALPVQLQQVSGPHISAQVSQLDAHRSAIAFAQLQPGTYAFMVQTSAQVATDNKRSSSLSESSVENEVMDAVQQWAEAWSARDMDTYLGAYSKAFALPAGTSRQQWVEMRRVRILNKRSIQVDVLSPKVEIDGDQARVEFRQLYKADTMRFDERKTLMLQREEGVWRIRAETVNG